MNGFILFQVSYIGLLSFSSFLLLFLVLVVVVLLLLFLFFFLFFFLFLLLFFLLMLWNTRIVCFGIDFLRETSSMVRKCVKVVIIDTRCDALQKFVGLDARENALYIMHEGALDELGVAQELDPYIG